MIDKQQAEVIGDVLMSEKRADREIAEKRKRDEEQPLLTQQRFAIWGLAGMAAGALVGHFAFGSWSPSMLVGFGVGALLGRWAPTRARR